MDLTEALAALQLTPGATWPQVRARYRSLLRANHPDLTDDPGAAERTARLTAAYAALQKATGNGRRPLRSPAVAGGPSGAPAARTARRSGPEPASGRTGPGRATTEGPGTTGAVVGRRSPTDVFGRLRAAAPAVGNLSGVDPETLTLQILVEVPGAAPAQLLAEVSRRGADTAIMFTLESLTSAPGPPIEAIVKRLLAAL
ncbi:MAG: J domain-containing protein [bacterium]|nr:J domain-containing protein [bacterium]